MSVALDSGEVGTFAFGHVEFEDDPAGGIRGFDGWPPVVPAMSSLSPVRHPHERATMFRLPGARRGEGFTSASAHPELISGDFAIPPRRHCS